MIRIRPHVSMIRIRPYVTRYPHASSPSDADPQCLILLKSPCCVDKRPLPSAVAFRHQRLLPNAAASRHQQRPTTSTRRHTALLPQNCRSWPASWPTPEMLHPTRTDRAHSATSRRRSALTQTSMCHVVSPPPCSESGRRLRGRSRFDPSIFARHPQPRCDAAPLPHASYHTRCAH